MRHTLQVRRLAIKPPDRLIFASDRMIFASDRFIFLPDRLIFLSDSFIFLSDSFIFVPDSPLAWGALKNNCLTGYGAWKIKRVPL